MKAKSPRNAGQKSKAKPAKKVAKKPRFFVDDGSDKDGTTFFVYDGKTQKQIGDSFSTECEAQKVADALNENVQVFETIDALITMNKMVEVLLRDKE